MSRLTQRECILLALRERGETRVKSASTKWEFYTATYAARRTFGDTLVPYRAPGVSFWMVGKTGAMRLARDNAVVYGSLAVHPDSRAALIAEGAAIAAKGVRL